MSQPDTVCTVPVLNGPAPMVGAPHAVAIRTKHPVDSERRGSSRLKRAARRDPILLSSATGQGVETVLRALVEVIRAAGSEAPKAEDEGYDPAQEPIE